MIRFSHEANSWQVHNSAAGEWRNCSTNVARVHASIGQKVWWEWDQIDFIQPAFTLKNVLGE